MYSCMLSGFAEAHAVMMGERKDVTEVKGLAFTNGKLASVAQPIPTDVDGSRLLLQAIAETLLNFCIGPLLQRLGEISAVADANSEFTGKFAELSKDATANEKLDMKFIKASYNARLKCLRSICLSG
jgi:hypothetical protein